MANGLAKTIMADVERNAGEARSFDKDSGMELRVDFRSQEEWNSWHDAFAKRFATWRQRIVTSVQAHGLIEPLTEVAASAGDVRINPQAYMESFSYNGLNSRKRGLLMELDCLRRQFPRFATGNTRIFCSEALSRTALILRGMYPFCLGTEYIPDVQKRAGFYPIQHADLTDLDMPDNIFDVVMTGDVLEHIPDMYRALQEMSRVLRPGGALISTFPFEFQSRETVVVAKMENGQIVHLREPEYHGDPLDPQGVLVFQFPGWDILDMCRDVGLRDARMVMHASSSHGVIADKTPGVFVLSAMKAGDESERPRRSWLWDAARINRLVGVLGLPRSGTTMFAAVLDAHDDVTSIYEPWNAHKKELAAGTKQITVNSLIAEAETQSNVARTMVVKETTTQPSFVKGLSGILDQALTPISRHLLILLRNPLHSFLSQIDGRRKWWGEASLEITQEVFAAWASRTLDSYSELLQLADKYKGVFVFYEACVSNPAETFDKVMNEIGLEFKPSQLQITKNSDLSRIRGDQSLVEDARDVGDASVSKREAELEASRAVFSMTPLFGTINGVCELFREFTSMGVIGVADAERGPFVSALRALLSQPRK